MFGFIFSLVYLLGVYLFVKLTVGEGTLQIVRLTQYYALSALGALYITLFLEALHLLKSSDKKVKKIYKHYKTFLFLTLIFGVAHGSFGFFTQLGGFAGLPFLGGRYLYGVFLAISALILFTISHIKALKVIVQIGGIFVLVHAFLIGTHFSILSDLLPQVVFASSAIVLILYAFLFDRFMKSRWPFLPTGGLVTLLVAIFLSLAFMKYFSTDSSDSTNALSAHARHLKQAKQNDTSSIFAKRFSASFTKPENIALGQKTKLIFDVYEAASGKKVTKFNLFQEKLMHLIIVHQDLEYFNHIHPELVNGQFSVETEFPQDGEYHIYTDFEPQGEGEQQFGFTLTVGKTDQEAKKDWKEDLSPVRVKSYEVSLEIPQALNSADVTQGKQSIKFKIRDIDSSGEFKNLKPYLGAFGHLVMINTATFDYIHVHPINQNLALLGESGGPEVEFSPLGMFGPIAPGLYRSFAQFSPNGELITADFTIQIK